MAERGYVIVRRSDLERLLRELQELKRLIHKKHSAH